MNCSTKLTRNLTLQRLNSCPLFKRKRMFPHLTMIQINLNRLKKSVTDIIRECQSKPRHSHLKHQRLKTHRLSSKQAKKGKLKIRHSLPLSLNQMLPIQMSTLTNKVTDQVSDQVLHGLAQLAAKVQVA